MSIATINPNHYVDTSHQSLPKSSLVPLPAPVHEPIIPTKNWHERAITYLNGIDDKLNEIPNLPIQNKLDQIGSYIETKFASLTKFNDWIDSNGEGAWYKQLAIFLVKLPMRAVRNILKLLYNIIKGFVYACVHPLKALNNLAKMLVNLARELTKPETWSKLGIGMIGASLGSAAVTGNPLSVVGFGIGIAMLIGGLTVGSVKAALGAEQRKFEAVKNHLWEQGKELPEVFFTGFILGLIMGGIQKAGERSEQATFRVTDKNSAQAWSDRYVNRYDLPKPDSVRYVANNYVQMEWSKSKLVELFHKRPSLFVPNYMKYSKLSWSFNPANAHSSLFQNMGMTHGTPFLAMPTNAGTIVLKA